MKVAVLVPTGTQSCRWIAACTNKLVTFILLWSQNMNGSCWEFSFHTLRGLWTVIPKAQQGRQSRVDRFRIRLVTMHSIHDWHLRPVCPSSVTLSIIVTMQIILCSCRHMGSSTHLLPAWQRQLLRPHSRRGRTPSCRHPLRSAPQEQFLQPIKCQLGRAEQAKTSRQCRVHLCSIPWT